MATPTFDRIIIDMSYKLRDPVTDAKADGKIYHYEAKARYIRRAYLRLKRNIDQVAPSLVTQYFTDIYKYIVLKLEKGTNEGDVIYKLDETAAALFDIKQPLTTLFSIHGLTIPLSAIFGTTAEPEFIFHVNDMFARTSENSKPVYKSINFTEAEKFFKIINGEASAYYKQGNLHYAVVGNNLLIAAGDVKADRLKLFVPNYVPVFKSDGPRDLIINNAIEDLLVLQACLEAVIDKGDNQSFGKARYYSSFISNELSLIKYKESAQTMQDKLSSNK